MNTSDIDAQRSSAGARRLRTRSDRLSIDERSASSRESIGDDSKDDEASCFRGPAYVGRFHAAGHRE